MSIKDLFKAGKTYKVTKEDSFQNTAEKAESQERIESVSKYLEEYVPEVDYSSASNFARYGLAEEYYANAIDRISQQWPYDGSFDAIFCRNVVIYFDKPTQRALFDRFATMLPMGGLLFVGHSESLYRVTDRFRLIGKTIYERIS